MQNQHWHGDCKTKTEKVLVGYEAGRDIYVYREYCKKHDISVCRCGWEVGYHYGYEKETKHIEAIKGKNMEDVLRVYEASIC